MRIDYKMKWNDFDLIWHWIFKLKFKWNTQNCHINAQISFYHLPCKLIAWGRLTDWLSEWMDLCTYHAHKCMPNQGWLAACKWAHAFVGFLWLVGSRHRCISNDMCNNSVKFHFVWWFEIELHDRCWHLKWIDQSIQSVAHWSFDFNRNLIGGVNSINWLVHLYG